MQVEPLTIVSDVSCSIWGSQSGQRSAARCVQRDRAAVGQPPLQVGGDPLTASSAADVAGRNTPPTGHQLNHVLLRPDREVKDLISMASRTNLRQECSTESQKCCEGKFSEACARVPGCSLLHRHTSGRGTGGGRSAWAACSLCTTRPALTTSAVSPAIGRSRPAPRLPWAAPG